MSQQEPNPRFAAPPRAVPRGGISDVAGNVTQFMLEKEAQVLRVIDAFNRVMGTLFTTTTECEKFSLEHPDMLPGLQADQEKEWAAHLSARRAIEGKKNRIRITLLCLACTLAGFILGRL